MTFDAYLFYAFSAVLITAAVVMIIVRNPVYAALSLIVCFFSCAAMWILLQAEFLGIVLILVYVGAVMVLFLFVIMMLDINFAQLKAGFTSYLPVGSLVALVIAAEMIFALKAGGFEDNAKYQAQKFASDYSNTQALGELLYTEYLYPFEVAAVILLVAIIAAITLTLRSRPDSKSQRPDQQVRVRKEDRVRLVKMESGE